MNLFDKKIVFFILGTALVFGAFFVWALGGRSIEINKECINRKPLIAISPPYAYVSPNQEAKITVQITNENNVFCDPTIFTVTDIMPAEGWESKISNNALLIRSGLTNVIQWTIKSAPDAKLGNYYPKIKIVDEKNPTLETEKDLFIKVE